jgi:addiction module HigA family antidote
VVKKLRSVHPGEVLEEEFLTPFGISAYMLAKHIHVSQTTVSQILNAKRGITADMALRLSAAFGTTPEFWVNLQTRFDLEETMDKRPKLAKIIRFDFLPTETGTKKRKQG